MARVANNVVVFGGNGAIGKAMANLYGQEADTQVFAISRSVVQGYRGNVEALQADFDGLTGEGLEPALQRLSETLAGVDEPINRVFITTGFLHGEGSGPEKSLKDLEFEQLSRVFNINAIMPALCARYFLPLMNRNSTSVFAALSARVGSIGDNQLGGWYGYRASKAALNMFIKTASIEMKRKNPTAIIVGLHPGTVASALSAPFSSRVPEHKLFSPDYAAQCLKMVTEQLQMEDSGGVFAWDGSKVPE